MLPLGRRPTLGVPNTARLLIANQAPGTKEDRTGHRILQGCLMGSTTEVAGFLPRQFHDVRRVAMLPMGWCYPGRQPNGGNASPRPE